MLVFPQQRLTFLATPKTGTTAVEMALRPHADIVFAKGRKHINAARFQRKVAPFLQDTFGLETETLAVMRAPIDQIRSWYKYRARPELEGTPRSTKNMSFDDFVLAVISETPPESAQIGSQYGFFTTSTGTVAVTHLFAYDNQSALVEFLQRRLATSIKLERTNVSPSIPAGLSPEVEQLLRSARAKEFALYAELTAAQGYLHFPTKHAANAQGQ